MSIENRKDERHFREEKILIEVLSASDTQANDSVILECTTKDISMNGLKIVSTYPFIVGAILELLIKFESGGYQFLLTGEVRWFEELENDLFLAGFELIEAEHSDYMVWKNMFEAVAEEVNAS